ncbi:MAG: transglycosylase SLT domain-containing protein [Gammaproteobacteria bacterium]|nr:transglycosylase SLT domain-containing protein [Gammaproteobacteria bacterium]MCP5425423.1 transglycosylase SLT domain-containing protein [Gammaproteobacteria bacterium]MCP5459772.1 transglycosylase SLT domain-containing protein [Gammaproteobacteria bacterium]
MLVIILVWPGSSLGETSGHKRQPDQIVNTGAAGRDRGVENEAKPEPVVLQRVAPSPDVIILLREGRATGVTHLPGGSKHPAIKTLQAHVKPIEATGGLPAAQSAGVPTKPPITKVDRSKNVKSLKDGLWDRVRKRLVLVDDENPRIEERIAYIRNNPGYLNLLANRCAPFLHFIVEETERRGLPSDLALLPMVESAFDPTAISPKGAAGLWQIMPATGEQYGLQIVDGYDGRYDVYSSTRAALTYLSYLHKLFNGDWLLALAAYNVGEGAVQKAMQAAQEAGLEANYWNLDLPAETKAYVPQIAALSRVVFDPQENGLKLKKINTLPYLARIKVEADSELLNNVAASGVPIDEFSRFNPAFKAYMDIPERTYNLMLPLDQAELLAQNLDGAELIAVRTHTVKKGDTLSKIADQYGISYVKLAQWNSLSVKSVLLPGQELLIYPASRG